MPETVDAAPETQTTVGPWFLEGPRIDLDLSGRALDELNRLLEVTGDSPEVLLSKAMGLYQLYVAAHREGKAVGAAASPDVLDIEFEP